LSQKTIYLETDHGENFVILACTDLIQCWGVSDGRTDRRTDGQTPGPWLRRAKHSAIARKKTVMNLRGLQHLISCEVLISI